MGIKYKVNEEFFDTWSSEMAYVFGYVYADGCLIDGSSFRGRYLTVSSVEKYSIERIRKWMESKHVIMKKKPSWPNGKIGYVLRIGSYKIYERLLELGLYPNKSLTIQFPNVPGKYLGDFVRGYLDGDGCVYLEMGRGKQVQSIIKRLSVIFTSGSRVFLEKMNRVLNAKLLLRRTKVYRGDKCYQLRYRTFNSIRLFKFLYDRVKPNMFFQRKLAVFQKYFALRPSKIDPGINKVLKHVSRYGHVVK